MECDYKGVIYCKKEIGPTGNGGPFAFPCRVILRPARHLFAERIARIGM